MTGKARKGARREPTERGHRAAVGPSTGDPAASPRPVIGDRAALLVALALGSAFGLHRIVDPDVFLHAAVGRTILREPAALGVSTFIDAHPSYRYVEDKWLASVVVALADVVAGADGLMAYQLGLCALVAGAWYVMQRAWGASPAVSVVGVALALLALTFRLEPRPDTISHALVALTIGLVAADLGVRRLAWLVPALLALWVNLHGYFVNGLLVLLAAALGTTLGDRRSSARPGAAHGPTTRQWLGLLGLAVAACLVHPQGWQALVSPARQILELGRDPVFRSSIHEFSSSTTLFRGLGLARWILLAVTAGAVVVTGFLPAQRRSTRQVVAAAAAVPWLVSPPAGLASVSYALTFALALMALFEIPTLLRERQLVAPMLFAGAVILAFPMVRNLALVPPAALIVLAPAWTAAAGEAARLYSVRGARALALAGLFVVVLAAGWLRLSDRMSVGIRAPIRTGWGIDADRFPAAAADFVERHRLPGPLLNNFDVGGFLLYRLHPRRRVFIAGNTSMYPLSFLEYYRSAFVGAEADPNALYARHGVRTIVLDLAADDTLALLARVSSSPDWALVFLDRAGAVYLHVDDTTRSLAARLRLDVATRVPALATQDRSDPALPVWLGGTRLPYPSLNLGLFLRAIGRPDVAFGEANRLWERTRSASAAVLAGQSALQTGRLVAQLPRLEEAQRLHPDSEILQTLLMLGLAYRVDERLGAGAAREAERDLQRMVALDPSACGPYIGLAKVAALERDREKARTLLAEAARKDRDGGCRRRAQSEPLLAPLLADPSSRGGLR